MVCAQIAEPMNACSFAAGLSSQESGVGAGFGAFHGQMGCIYLFEDILNPGKSKLYSFAYSDKQLHAILVLSNYHFGKLQCVPITLHYAADIVHIRVSCCEQG